MMRFKNVRYYHLHVRHRAAASDCTDDWNAINYTATSRKKGSVWARPLTFRDGSSLRFEEEVLIDNDGFVHRPSYAYHYEGPGNHFHFRYDRDPEHQRPVVHEECHLHVIQKEPRFKTHATSFDEVFDFIVACFLQQVKMKNTDYNGFRGGHNLLKLLSHKTVTLSDPGESGPMSGHVCPHGKHLFPGVSA